MKKSFERNLLKKCLKFTIIKIRAKCKGHCFTITSIIILIILSFITGQYIFFIIYLVAIIVCALIVKHILSNKENSIAKIKSQITLIKSIPLAERILILLNTASNKNGRSWWKGVGFTLSSAFIFYSLYAVSTEQYFFTLNPAEWAIWKDNFWKEALNFFWLPSGFKELNSGDLTAWSAILYIIGKIFIGYGIYQTISAFRKYGK